MRAELLGQLVAAQFEIEGAMKEMAGNAAALSDGNAQLQLLSALQRQIGVASPTALAGMRSEIIATASAAQAAVLQSRAAALSSECMADLRDVTNATRQTIQNVAEDLFEKKKLDPYLQFASAEDEAGYRKREAERKTYIRAETAKGTPEGALNAINAMADQLEDAKDHGADRSPHFDKMYGTITAAGDAQRGVMGLAPTKQPVETQRSETSVLSKSGETSPNLDEIAATLRKAGVEVPDVKATPLNAHGLKDTANIETATVGRSV